MISFSWICKTFFQIPIFLIAANSAFAAAPKTFQFESIASIDDMRKAIEADFPPKSPQSSLRNQFIAEGSATLKIHPTQAGVEKYIYDINLCSYYVWRWNISADYDTSGHLLQAYVNGEPVFASGKQKKDGQAFAKSGKASILQVTRPRPEATKGGTCFLVARR
jgi:hypothetical protein